ncbi:carboxymuconolactone decarboxylase family protein [Novosphingobium album (ex Liu et al. 2023)]|uniref:Carboxymuconolactone decarboxylase family protein n=1 Tax=Novosphingobium album (ex Liu et al. 2023) TaxID=3031130 RepID=A0ABT5WQN7_9SPHN|nr:carboxymuconolactone decarboxylase family protein [Novosphingobium album (ex Liu et al. 2023)]MDE8652357.1 carboxymuconolactone decarboxylase family protein [Novosphingobium album (ex Liu et al. 2023)]
MERDFGFDVAAREAQVVGEEPRIGPVASESLDDATIELILKIRASAGVTTMDEVPEYMRTMIRHPEIFRCQMEMGTVLFKGRIPAREREIAILRIGWLCRAPYEWGQHVNIARRVGLTTEEIERARRGSGAEGWSAHEAAILKGVEELLDDKAISDATWAVLARSWDEAQMIEFPMMVGQYVATAFVQNSLRIRLEAGNPGLAHG